MRVANREKKIWVHRSLVWKTDLVHSDSFIYNLTKPPFGLHLFQQVCQKKPKKYQDCPQIATYILTYVVIERLMFMMMA